MSIRFRELQTYREDLTTGPALTTNLRKIPEK